MSAAPRPERDPEAALAVGPRGEALAAISEAFERLHEAKDALGKAAKIVIAAATEPDPAQRALLAERYEDAAAVLDELGGEDAPQLLKSGGRMLVPLGHLAYAIEPFPIATGAWALHLPAPNEGFASHSDVANTLKQVETALERLAKAHAGFRRDAERLSRGMSG